MRKVLLILGIVLAIVGAGISAFTGIPASEFAGICVAMVGAAIACTGVVKQAQEEGKNKPLTYASVALLGIGSFILGFSGLPDTTVTQIVTVVAGLVTLIAGLVVAVLPPKPK